MGKLEFLSPGGSVKDRIARSMVEAAEKDGVLVLGRSIVVEATSGNTGTDFCLLSATFALFDLLSRYWSGHGLRYQGRTYILLSREWVLNRLVNRVILSSSLFLRRCRSQVIPSISTSHSHLQQEKELTLLALGARVIRTPTGAPSESPHSNIGTSQRSQKHTKHSTHVSRSCQTFMHELTRRCHARSVS